MKLKILLSTLLILISPAIAEPANVSIHLEYNPSTVFVDGDEKTSSFSTSEFENPFIASDQPLGLIGYRNPIKLEYVDGGSDDELIVYSGRAETSFLVPFSTGGYEVLANREDEISENNILSLIPPSFAFDQIDSEIEVIYDFSYPVTKLTGTASNIDAISIRNRIDSDNKTQFILQTE